MYSAKIYPLSSSDQGYVSGIYAGLYGLAADGELKLRLTLSPAARVQEKNGPYHFRNNQHVAWIEVRDHSTGEERKICFDMMDNKYISSLSGLRSCDVYFKRSYDTEYINSMLDRNMALKVRPYGFNHPVSSRDISAYLAHNVAQHAITAGASNLRSLARRLSTHYMISMGLRPKSVQCYPLVEDLLVSPSEPAGSKVLFLTRVFEPSKSANPEACHELNEFRVSVIRALKDAFPRQFIGGLSQQNVAEMPQYGDCATNADTCRTGYLATMKSCLVAVTTTGLASSIGWKFPEYLAASRCVVSEPLRYETGLGIEEGRHFLAFETPDACVAACSRVLTNPEFADRLRHDGHQLFLDHVEPRAAVRRLLRRAFEPEPGLGQLQPEETHAVHGGRAAA